MDSHREHPEEARVVPGGAGKAHPEMAKHLYNTAAVTCLDLPSMWFRILVSKLGFIVRFLKKDDEDLGGSVVLSLCDDFSESCLVRECKELEDVFGTNFTCQILKECSGDVKQIKAAIYVYLKWTKSRFWPNVVRRLPPLWIWQRVLVGLT